MGFKSACESKMRQEKKGGKRIKKIWENRNKYQADWYKLK